MAMIITTMFTPSAKRPSGAASRMSPVAGRRLLGVRLALREDRVR